jgi:hypothetical protein
MASFPTLKSGTVSCYGLQRTASFATEVAEFLDDTEQRFRVRPPLARFTLVFKDIEGYDLNRVRAFWISTKGAFDATWDLTIAGVTYSNLCFEGDLFSPNEQKQNRYSLELKVLQVKP